MKHVISLGAGVQSSTMALMAAVGEIKPMPDAAIFADTQAEPESVYKWLDWLEKQLPFPVYRVTKGNLGEVAATVRISRHGNAYTEGAIPAFIISDEGKTGLLMRQCTSKFKIEIIEREIRRLRRADQEICQWIGISVDEAHRMKPCRLSYVTNIWPLINIGMTRSDCLDWMERQGFPRPPRSACIFCPFHNDAEWLDLKENQPKEFERAVIFEKQFQIAVSHTKKLGGKTFLHRSLVPLDQVDFKADPNRVNNFGNECEGVCGV
jgi:hypothetical protein